MGLKSMTFWWEPPGSVPLISLQEGEVKGKTALGLTLTRSPDRIM